MRICLRMKNKGMQDGQNDDRCRGREVSSSTPPGKMAHHNFSYDGLTVCVSCAEPEHLLWLQEFLCPWFDIDGGANATWEVELEVDDRQYERLLAKRPDD